MKHLSHILVTVVLFLCYHVQFAAAQEMPVDKNVRIGKLENGLTYYIRHNELPEKRAEFYIVQKVGSILEEPQQRGLAHFLEHMAFNGTKHFPGDENGLGIVQWCETKGIQFGTNLNAYTSIDQTVYNISNVPSENVNVVDSCLLILHDWSTAINLADDEIDKERGVIREEWRSRNDGMLRILTDAMPTIYPDSKYADCMPIGNIDVVNNFPYQDLRDYYVKWYRPDLQGIIVVGDINVDDIETKLKALFADVKAPVNPAKRIYYPITDNQEPLIYIGKDKEMENLNIIIIFKHETPADSLRNTISYYVKEFYIHRLIIRMLNARIQELLQTINPPFIDANVDYGYAPMTRTKDAFMLEAVSKADGIETAMRTILEEVERARRFGFTETEYERACANYLQAMESEYNEREKTKNESYVEEYINHFLDKEPIPGIEFEYELVKQLNIPLEVINQCMQEMVTDNNQAVLLAGPDKEEIKYPTKEEIAALLGQMGVFELTPYEDKVSNDPLITEELKGGEIISEKSDEIYDTTLLELSNGVKVYVKTTDYKADQIMMRGVSIGGNSLFPNEEIINISLLNEVALVGGIGNFSEIELRKALAGKRASVTARINNTIESVSGSCSPKDFETMMQLTYLTFTSPRKDEEAFESYKSRIKAQLQHADANPMTAFSDTVTYAKYGNHPRAIRIKEEMIDQIDYDRIIDMYKDRYKDASDFTFYLVGNIDIETVKPFIAKYLGSLPSINRKETFKDNEMNIRKGKYKNVFAKTMETPMASIQLFYSGNCEYNLQNSILLSFLSQALDIVYTAEIREKEGGTYGVSCRGRLSKFPKEEASLQIYFQTDPSIQERMAELVKELLQKMAKEGPSAEHLQKIKEYMLKIHQDSQKENNYWMNNLYEYFYTGVDKTKDYEELVNSVTAKEVQDFLVKLLEQGNEIHVTMTTPETRQ